MARRSLHLALTSAIAAPAAAQVPADRQLVRASAAAAGVDAFAGNDVTKEWVITREIRTKPGERRDPDEVARDIARLDNLRRRERGRLGGGAAPLRSNRYP